MLFKTEGIVLHVTRYRETSVIVKIFTELFGLQSYIVNGVRTSKAKAKKGNLLQPANILDLVVYHREEKNLQRISEFKPAYIYQHLYGNIVKNTTALFVVELLEKCLSEPESNPELFYFSKHALEWMDQHAIAALTNLPLYFTLRAAALQGFEIYGSYSTETAFLDLREGAFVNGRAATLCLNETESLFTYQLLRLYDMNQLTELQIPKKSREQLLNYFMDFLKLHIPGFRDLRSPAVLKSVLH